VGGRARGRIRPRAPSLTERPSGHRRTFSLNVPVILEGSDDSDHKSEGDAPKRREMNDVIEVGS